MYEKKGDGRSVRMHDGGPGEGALGEEEGDGGVHCGLSERGLEMPHALHFADILWTKLFLFGLALREDAQPSSQ